VRAGKGSCPRRKKWQDSGSQALPFAKQLLILKTDFYKLIMYLLKLGKIILPLNDEKARRTL
jgi:hypothetical protein